MFYSTSSFKGQDFPEKQTANICKIADLELEVQVLEVLLRVLDLQQQWEKPVTFTQDP